MRLYKRTKHKIRTNPHDIRKRDKPVNMTQNAIWPMSERPWHTMANSRWQYEVYTGTTNIQLYWKIRLISAGGLAPSSARPSVNTRRTEVLQNNGKFGSTCHISSQFSIQLYHVTCNYVCWKGKGWPVVACLSRTLVVLYWMLTIFACYVLNSVFGMLFLFSTTSLGCFCPRTLLFE